MKVTIDRFEGEFAVVEIDVGKFANMPISLVPQGANEGDVLDISIDENEGGERKENIKNLMDELWKS